MSLVIAGENAEEAGLPEFKAHGLKVAAARPADKLRGNADADMLRESLLLPLLPP
jgi:hypothetical protein